MSAGSSVRYVLARLPVRVGASIGKLSETSAVCARADDGRGCGRCGHEAVVACEDQEITFFAKDALLHEGVPEVLDAVPQVVSSLISRAGDRPG
jgi:phage terminase large subunit-like protein